MENKFKIYETITRTAQNMAADNILLAMADLEIIMELVSKLEVKEPEEDSSFKGSGSETFK